MDNTLSNDSFSLNADPSRIPEIIDDKFELLKEVDKKVKHSQLKADSAKRSAYDASEKSAKLGHRTDAIESLQHAVKDQSEAIVATADANTVSFEYMRKLNEICIFLFELGIANIASTRTVIQALESKMDQASQEELDDLAREQIKSVISQLKSQQDIFDKQQRLTDKVHKHDIEIQDQKKRILASEEKNKSQDKSLTRQAKKDQEHDRRIDAVEKKGKNHDRELALHAKLSKEHEKRLDDSGKKDLAQDAELFRLAQKDIEHDERINASDRKNKSQDDELTRQAAKDEDHDRRIDAVEKKGKNHDRELALQAKVFKEYEKQLDVNNIKELAQDEELHRQAQKDIELDERINASDLKNKSQDDELTRQAAKDEVHDKILFDLESRIKGLEIECDQLRKQLYTNDTTHSKIEMQLQSDIDSKANTDSLILPLVIGALGLIVAIIGLLF